MSRISFPVELWVNNDDSKVSDLEGYRIAADESELKTETIEAAGEKLKPVIDKFWGGSFLARWLIDHDVNAVVGCHSHCLQPLDFYHGRPVIYSLGKLVFDGAPDLESWNQGELLEWIWVGLGPKKLRFVCYRYGWTWVVFRRRQMTINRAETFWLRLALLSHAAGCSVIRRNDRAGR